MRDYLKEAIRILQGKVIPIEKNHLKAFNTRLEEEGVYLVCEHFGEEKNGVCLECGETL